MNGFDPQKAGEEFVKRLGVRKQKKLESCLQEITAEWVPKIEAAREALEAKCRSSGIEYPQCVEDWIALGLACGIKPYPRTAGEIVAIACIERRTAQYRQQLDAPPIETGISEDISIHEGRLRKWIDEGKPPIAEFARSQNVERSAMSHSLTKAKEDRKSVNSRIHKK